MNIGDSPTFVYGRMVIVGKSLPILAHVRPTGLVELFVTEYQFAGGVAYPTYDREEVMIYESKTPGFVATATLYFAANWVKDQQGGELGQL